MPNHFSKCVDITSLTHFIASGGVVLASCDFRRCCCWQYRVSGVCCAEARKHEISWRRYKIVLCASPKIHASRGC